MRKAFRYRCYPTRAQRVAMETMLATHRHLYNRALAERKAAWETERRAVRYQEQSGQLREGRTISPHLALTNFSSCQATLRRLDRAFTAFFRRLEAGEMPGYPRFRGYGRFESVVFPKYGDSILAHKAEEAGVTVIAVDPRHTSQACSACGAPPAVPKTLADRVHVCPCGCVLDRDENAARNILRLGLSRQAPTPPLGDVA